MKKVTVGEIREFLEDFEDDMPLEIVMDGGGFGEVVALMLINNEVDEDEDEGEPCEENDWAGLPLPLLKVASEHEIAKGKMIDNLCDEIARKCV